MTHVAIIGGGYAGMSAAATLATRKIKVTVFEAARQLGGRARRVDYRDEALDNGLHILIGAYTETLRLIELVNSRHASAVLRMPLEWKVHEEFHLRAANLPAPFHLLVGLASAQGLGIAEKFSAARFLAKLRSNRYKLERDLSVETLLKQHAQSETLRRVLWRPLCVAALNTPPQSASAQVFLNVLRDSLDATQSASDLVLAKVDLSALLPEPAAAYVEHRGGTVLRSQRVTAIDPLASGFEIEANNQRATFTHVICAISPHQVNAFLIGITALSEIAAVIDQLRYQPIHSVWLKYPGSVSLPSPMLGLTRGLIHWVFDRETLCGQRGLVGAVISAAGEHENLTQDELGARIHCELQQHVSGLPDPLWTRVIAEKRATFACMPGVRRPPQVTPLKNFYLAGDYTESDYPATIESAVRSGIVCAEHIAQQA
ncbi:MAG: squalene-associated FAD-dependent desaturase [Betaproteobacteria bacterium]|nr:squalene-associated FAD-dependent desaturase [Betaproteobacteria bacterium]